MKSIEGLHLFPTKSKEEAPADSLNNLDGIIRRAFTFNQALTDQTGNGASNYLTVDLNEFADISSNNVNLSGSDLLGAFNTIMVQGHIFRPSSTTTSDCIAFKHRFITDYDFSPTSRTKVEWGYNSSLESYKFSFEDQVVSSNSSDEWDPALGMYLWKTVQIVTGKHHSLL